MSGYIMSTFPGTTNSLTSSCGKIFSGIAHLFPCVRIPKKLALSTREPKTTVDNWGPKEPLRYEDPPHGHGEVS